MADDATVRWEGGGPPGCVLGLGSLPVSILLATALNRFCSMPWSPHGLVIIGTMFVIGVALGPVIDHYQVTTAEFTRHQVRLVSRAAVHTVDAADLMSVMVTHSGYTDEGYSRTSLHVAWPGGKETIDGGHDATLAPSLSRILPPGIEVRHVWEKLEDPPSGA